MYFSTHSSHLCRVKIKIVFQVVLVNSCGRNVDASALVLAVSQGSAAASSVSSGANVLAPHPTSKAPVVSLRPSARGFTSGRKSNESLSRLKTFTDVSKYPRWPSFPWPDDTAIGRVASGRLLCRATEKPTIIVILINSTQSPAVQ